MDYAKTVCSAWVYIYVTDKILDLAYRGSVKAAIQTCTSLAGLEYAEVGGALLKLSEVFHKSVFKAVKTLLRGMEAAVGPNLLFREHTDSITLGKKEIRVASEDHKRAILSAYKFMYMLNDKVESLRTALIVDQQSLKKHLEKTFTNSTAAVEKALLLTQTLTLMCQRQLTHTITSSTQPKTRIPNGLVWNRIMFCTGEKQRLKLYPENDNPGDAATEVETNTWISFNSDWGPFFVIEGTLNALRFDEGQEKSQEGEGHKE